MGVRPDNLETVSGDFDLVRDKMLEAEEVFASLTIPLMKLVGLQTPEMVTEGRFSTIVIQTYQFFALGFNFKTIQLKFLKKYELIKVRIEIICKIYRRIGMATGVHYSFENVGGDTD
ncbi:hypothetical protein ACFX1Z_039253 [Malus domestica]